MNVLDTSVLVYAVGGDHPKRESCRRVIASIEEGLLNATTTVEAIQEFIHVRSRRRSRADAAALGLEYAALLTPLVAPTAEDLREGVRIFEGSSKIGAFDAVIAAVAIARGAALISIDNDFALVDGLEHVDPSSPEFEALLASKREL
ncbi:MAG: VapC toxin family PIN domain ribonuclease [Acidobacteria bacterium]|nr:MAG: VapC toxin family PIN domain ribonuclease [Acidobacteriota bacterium]